MVRRPPPRGGWQGGARLPTKIENQSTGRSRGLLEARTEQRRLRRTGDVARSPAAPGLYAWWAAPTVLPELTGPVHLADGSLRLLHVGIAAKLRSRLGQNHMRRTGSSTLRRTLAGLLLDDEAFRTRWTDRVVLVDEDEARFTWVETNLRVSWCEHPTPRDVEPLTIQVTAPPLNVDHASGPARNLIRAARQRYYASAGPRPVGRGATRAQVGGARP